MSIDPRSPMLRRSCRLSSIINASRFLFGRELGLNTIETPPRHNCIPLALHCQGSGLGEILQILRLGLNSTYLLPRYKSSLGSITRCSSYVEPLLGRRGTQVRTYGFGLRKGSQLHHVQAEKFGLRVGWDHESI
jgi:hypothetical protein